MFLSERTSYVNVFFVFVLFTTCIISSSGLAPLGVRLLRQEEYKLPPCRKFLPLPPLDELSKDAKESVCATFRVLQFNMLADGLSGLRDDLGAFSRTKAEDMLWGKRGQVVLIQ
jgi:hypothetical protein